MSFQLLQPSHPVNDRPCQANASVAADADVTVMLALTNAVARRISVIKAASAKSSLALSAGITF
jgi:hypothetical protein